MKDLLAKLRYAVENNDCASPDTCITAPDGLTVGDVRKLLRVLEAVAALPERWHGEDPFHGAPYANEVEVLLGVFSP